jgi:hypothetical protein
MLRNGRDADQNFDDPSEPLYRRCRSDEIEQDGLRILGPKISYKNMSVNRGRYSDPQDVIFEQPTCGIAQWSVSDVPGNIIPSPGKGDPFSFRPAHVPEELNYSHCEIWAYKGDVRVEKPDPSTEVKKLYRQIMSDRSRIIHPPSA